MFNNYVEHLILLKRNLQANNEMTADKNISKKLTLINIRLNIFYSLLLLLVFFLFFIGMCLPMCLHVYI